MLEAYDHRLKNSSTYIVALQQQNEPYEHFIRNNYETTVFKAYKNIQINKHPISDFSPLKKLYFQKLTRCKRFDSKSDFILFSGSY